MVTIKPDFDAQSRNGLSCSISGLHKPSGKRNNRLERDFDLRNPFVITLAQIEFEGDFDVLPQTLAAIAQEHCDMVPGEAYRDLEAALAKAGEREEIQAREVARLQALVDALAENFPARETADAA